MAVNQPQASVRTQILLEGGGRLEGIAEIADIRLVKDRMEWTRIAEDSVEVTGAINAYIYALMPRTNEVKGQGIQIPFTHQVTDDNLRTKDLAIDLEDLTSEHEFNPITGDFQHRVTAVIVVTPKQVLSGNLQSRGETVLSQIAVGERPPREEPETPPASTRPPSPEEFESMRQALEQENSKDPVEQVETVKAVAPAGPSDEGAAEEVPPDAKPLLPLQGSDEREDNGPLEWKPFPPPIA